MKLTCPSCGAIHSAEAWTNDAHARQAMIAISDLPPVVGRRALFYLALFRPASGRGLAWRRAGKLLGELREIIASGHVQWKKKVSRPCPPSVWAAAMDRMTANPPRDLPIDSHGYLKSIAYSLADDADRSAEKDRSTAERTGSFRRPPGAGGQPEKIDPAVLKTIRKNNMGRKRK